MRNPPLPLRERDGERGKNKPMPDRTAQIAKTLRRRMTDAERQLWTQLRAHRMTHWKLKRQQPLGPYIVDFVCF